MSAPVDSQPEASLRIDDFRDAISEHRLEWAVEKLKQMNTGELIDLMRSATAAEALLILRMLNKEESLEVFEMLEPHEQAELIEGLEGPEAQRLIADLDAAEMIELMDELPAKVVKRITNLLSPQALSELNLLLGYPDDSVGREMDPRYLAVRDKATAAQALNLIRQSKLDYEDLDYVFVIGPQRQYLGYIPLAKLIKADPDTPVSELAIEPDLHVSAQSRVSEATKLFREYEMPVLPVLDNEGRLVGILHASDALSLLEEEDAQRLVQFGGAIQGDGPDLDLRSTPITKIYKARVVWLTLLAFFGVITSTVVARQEAMLEAAVVLAAFIAPVLGMGGNTGSQSATLVIRAMSLGQIHINWRDFFFAIRRDLAVALLLGVTVALIEVVFVRLSRGIGWDVLAVVGISMFLVIVIGSLMGLALPMAARRAGIDPATLSAPAITTIMDFVGVLIYFGIAHLILGHRLS
jgi:magnesium transporter